MKKNNQNLIEDDKKYWQERHEKTSNLKASGIKSVGVKSNHYIYSILANQYKKLLDDLQLSPKTSVLDCGFGDGYFLDFFKKNYPDMDIHGVDISEHAKKKIDFIKKENLYVRDLTKFSLNKQFDLVHCFDVLYHILDNTDYENALKNLTSHSRKYVILHERFLDKAPLVSSKHVRLRNGKYTEQILNSQGFYLHKEMPTHFFAMRLLTYKINKFIPKVLYKIDDTIAKKMHPSSQESLATHKIRVYVKSPAV